MSRSVKWLVYGMACVLLMITPVYVSASGGGGGSGGGGSGGGGGGGGSDQGTTAPGMIFFEPDEQGDIETTDGVPVLTNAPEPGQPFVTLTEKKLTSAEKEALVQIAQEEVEFWDTMVSVAETADKYGKAAEVGLAFTPVGLAAQTALSAARGGAEGGTKGAVSAAAESVLTSKVNPVVATVMGEVADRAAKKAASNNAPVPSVGDPGVAPPDEPPLVSPGGGGPQTDHRSVFDQ